MNEQETKEYLEKNAAFKNLLYLEEKKVISIGLDKKLSRHLFVQMVPRARIWVAVNLLTYIGAIYVFFKFGIWWSLLVLAIAIFNAGVTNKMSQRFTRQLAKAGYASFLRLYHDKVAVIVINESGELISEPDDWEELTMKLGVN